MKPEPPTNLYAYRPRKNTCSWYIINKV
jgi:hypothetical protein